MNKSIFLLLVVICNSCSPDKPTKLSVERLSLESQKGDSSMMTEDSKIEDDKEVLQYENVQIIVADSLIINNFGIGNIKIGQKLGQIKSGVRYKIRDTIINENDVIWPALILFTQKKINGIALLESNWQNHLILNRITITDSSLQTTDGLKVGQRFIKILPMISKSIPTSPDGYLFLNHMSLSNIQIQLDISQHSALFFGVSAIVDIPINLKVSSIVIL